MQPCQDKADTLAKALLLTGILEPDSSKKVRDLILAAGSGV